MSIAPFADIEEAWGMSTLAPTLVNPYQDPLYQTTVLRSGTAPIAPEQLDAKSVRRHLTDAYRAGGLEGALPYLDPAIIRDIQASSKGRRADSFLAALDSMNPDDTMYLILALFALLFALDV
jgi:hypothetical protein